MVSSGRDAAVYLTDLRATEKHTLVCRETSPVLRMVMTPDQAGLWVATSESTIKHWPLNNRVMNGVGHSESESLGGRGRKETRKKYDSTISCPWGELSTA